MVYVKAAAILEYYTGTHSAILIVTDLIKMKISVDGGPMWSC